MLHNTSQRQLKLGANYSYSRSFDLVRLPTQQGAVDVIKLLSIVFFPLYWQVCFSALTSPPSQFVHLFPLLSMPSLIPCLSYLWQLDPLYWSLSKNLSSNLRTLRKSLHHRAFLKTLSFLCIKTICSSSDKTSCILFRDLLGFRASCFLQVYQSVWFLKYILIL